MKRDVKANAKAKARPQPPPPPLPTVRANPPSRPNPRTNPRRGGFGQRTGKQRGQFQAALAELRRGLPFTTPTRVEIVNTRVRFMVSLKDDTTCLPSILFHPCRSVVSLLCINGEKHNNFETLARTVSEDNDRGWLWEWVDQEAINPTDMTKRVDITAKNFSSAEAIGMPGSLIAPLTRVTGGVLNVKVTCGPGTSGYMSFSCPSFQELTGKHINATNGNGATALIAAHASNPLVKRLELHEGVINHRFVAPLVNPPSLEFFAEGNDRFLWGTDDAFGGILIAFHNINYNKNLGVPIVVECYATVGLQCRLELEDRHLATKHGTSTKEEKAKHTPSGSPHVDSTPGGADVGTR